MLRVSKTTSTELNIKLRSVRLYPDIPIHGLANSPKLLTVSLFLALLEFRDTKMNPQFLPLEPLYSIQ